MGNPSLAQSTGATLDYYLGVVRSNWSYIPSGQQQCPLGEGYNFDFYNLYDISAGWTGINFLKAHYVEYTDATFTTLKVRTGTLSGCRGNVVGLSVT